MATPDLPPRPRPSTSEVDDAVASGHANTPLSRAECGGCASKEEEEGGAGEKTVLDGCQSRTGALAGKQAAGGRKRRLMATRMEDQVKQQRKWGFKLQVLSTMITFSLVEAVRSWRKHLLSSALLALLFRPTFFPSTSHSSVARSLPASFLALPLLVLPALSAQDQDSLAWDAPLSEEELKEMFIFCQKSYGVGS
eukprot:3119257-Rhodomonas_salina.1